MSKIFEGGGKYPVNCVQFTILKIFKRWIRYGPSFVFLKADCKKSYLSSQNIIFYDYLPMGISGKFPENFRKIWRNFPENSWNSSQPHPYHPNALLPQPNPPWTPHPLHPLELQTRFSQYGKLYAIHRIFPTTFTYLYAPSGNNLLLRMCSLQ